MCEISAVELYVFYRDTIEKCNSATRSLPTDELLYNLYEEFPVGVTSFFHDTSSEKLLANDLIDSHMAKLSCRIRKSWFALQEQKWSVEEIRTEACWTRFFGCCDELLSKLEAGQEKRDISL